MLHTCGQLLLNSSAKLDIDETQTNHIFDDAENESSIDNLPSSSGTLFHFYIICLTLYMRYNDGTNNSILAVKLAENKRSILYELCEIVFDITDAKEENESAEHKSKLKLIYLKFLNKLFNLNYKNLNKQNSSNATNSSKASSITNLQSGLNKLALANIKMPSNHLFAEQFDLISGSLADNEANLKYFLKTSINYMHNYATSSNFIHSSSAAQLKSNYTTSPFAFDALLSLIDQTNLFIFENIFLLESDDAFDSDGSHWRKLIDILAEIKNYKNNYDHIQSCLRSKHTTQSCKANINEIGSRHNDITNINGSNNCLFAKLIKNLFGILLDSASFDKQFSIINENLDEPKTNTSLKLNRLVDLMSKLGVCTCIPLDELIDMQRYEATKSSKLQIQNNIRIDNYYFSPMIFSIVFEYLFAICSNSSSSSVAKSEKKSVFSNLLVDEALIKPKKSLTGGFEGSEASGELFAKFYDIISKFDEKSVLLCKYLSRTLRKYSKYVPVVSSASELAEISSSPNMDESNPAHSTQSAKADDVEINSNQSVRFKWMTYEIFYLFKDVLFVINNSFANPTADLVLKDKDKAQHHLSLLIFKIICKYMSEFLILTSSNASNQAYTDMQSNSTSSQVSSPTDKHNVSFRSPISSHEPAITSNHQLEMRMYAKFMAFIDKHSILIYENVYDLCSSFELNPHLSISICSQLILYKNTSSAQHWSDSSKSSQQATISIEHYLSKSLIDSIDKNIALLNNYNTLDILLELYIKCSTFRHTLNENQSFHSHLLSCLNKCLDGGNNDECINNQKYLEIILDLVFVYFYCNRKVGFIF